MSNTQKNSSAWQASASHTRLGTILCRATGNGISSVSFGKDIRSDTQRDPSPAPADVRLTLQNALEQLQAYLDRRLTVFDLPLDLTGCTPFQRQVLDEICKIPYGQTITYGQIAKSVGGMKHVRAVGGAVGSNPMPIVIPCHRVVSAGGHMQGYSGWGGIATKAWLLQLEGWQLIAEALD